MEWSLEYSHALDLIWFGCDQSGHILYFTSAGGVFPKSIESKGAKNDVLLSKLLLLEMREQSIVYNPDLDKYLKFPKESYKTDYLHNHGELAKRGFFTFDKVQYSNGREDLYFLVASPSEPIDQSSLAQDIRELLSKTRYRYNIDESVRTISVLDFD